LHLKPLMTVLEAGFLYEVYRLSDKAQVLYHHCSDSRKCAGPGLPDLIIVGTRGCLFREIKASPVDHPTSEQRLWLYALQASGQNARMWSSRDLDDGTVATEIAAIA
jgi:hypothetical protein